MANKKFNVSAFRQDMPTWMFCRQSQPADAYDPYLCSAWHERSCCPPKPSTGTGWESSLLPAGWYSCSSAVCIAQAWHCLIPLSRLEGEDKEQVLVQKLQLNFNRYICTEIIAYKDQISLSCIENLREWLEKHLLVSLFKTDGVLRTTATRLFLTKGV